jgi:hypothetical protein
MASVPGDEVVSIRGKSFESFDALYGYVQSIVNQTSHNSVPKEDEFLRHVLLQGGTKESQMVNGLCVKKSPIDKKMYIMGLDKKGEAVGLDIRKCIGVMRSMHERTQGGTKRPAADDNDKKLPSICKRPKLAGPVPPTDEANFLLKPRFPHVKSGQFLGRSKVPCALLGDRGSVVGRCFMSENLNIEEMGQEELVEDDDEDKSVYKFRSPHMRHSMLCVERHEPTPMEPADFQKISEKSPDRWFFIRSDIPTFLFPTKQFANRRDVDLTQVDMTAAGGVWNVQLFPRKEGRSTGCSVDFDRCNVRFLLREDLMVFQLFGGAFAGAFPSDIRSRMQKMGDALRGCPSAGKWMVVELAETLITGKNWPFQDSLVAPFMELWKTVCSHSIMFKAIVCPTLLYLGNYLFPHHFQGFLKEMHSEQLKQLEMTLRGDPWRLMFPNTMLHIVRSSGVPTLSGFMMMDVFPEHPALTTDAMTRVLIGTKETLDHIQKNIINRTHRNRLPPKVRWKYKGGDTCVKASELTADGIPEKGILRMCEESVVILVDGDGTVQDDQTKVLDSTWVTYPKVMADETTVSKSLASLFEKTPTVVYKPCTADVSSMMGTPDEDQRRVVEAIAKYPLCMVTGGGGTGKTFSTSWGLRMKGVPIDHVLLTGPTAMSARVLGDNFTKAYGTDISECNYSTMHSIIMSWGHFKKIREQFDQMLMAGGIGPEKKPPTWKYEEITTWVLDELSLASLNVFAHLFRLLMKGSQLQQVICMGDTNQIPSIEAGNIIKDLMTGSCMLRPCVVTLHTNHRAESKTIASNARKVLGSQFPEFNEENYIQMRPEVKDDMPDSERDMEIMKGRKKAVSHVFFSQDPSISQVIAVRRDDVDAWNTLAVEHYQKRVWKNGVFMRGDKIFNTRNRKIKWGAKSQENPDKHQKEVYIANGETFFIEDIYDASHNGVRGPSAKDTSSPLVFDMRMVRLSYVYSKEPPIDVPWFVFRKHVKLAYARTVHTFQGSEVDYVLFDQCERPQTRDMFYTATTRGKKGIIVLCSGGIVYKTIVHGHPYQRKSLLGSRIDKLFASKFK